jgi:predicted transglutaminase-like cysteine proteinase
LLFNTFHIPARFSFWMMGLLLLVAMVAGCCKKAPPLIKPVAPLYDEAASQRIFQWQTLIEDKREAPILEKLTVVNNFINHLEFVSDRSHWGQKDYWATPLETLVSNGGDCEDFTIAKYFTLKNMNVPDEKMRLTYVKSLTLNQAHMVLTYYHSPSADPLVLDNLVKRIIPASQRKDLVPIYSFNGTGIWLTKNDGYNPRVGESSRLKLWQDLLQRMKRY